MDDNPRQKLVSLDDLVAEVQALHSRVSQLERELARVRIETTIPRASGREPVEGWPHLHEVRPSDATPGEATPDSPVRQVLTADEDTAARHLERLRASITRLREERARAAAEFRMLTRPRAEGEASAPAEPAPQAAAPAPPTIVPVAPLAAVAAPAIALAATQESPESPAAAFAEGRPETRQREPGGELAAAASEPPAVPLAVAATASPAPPPAGHPGHAAHGGVDISTSFPTLAAARQALDEYAARLPNGTTSEPGRPREAAAQEPPAEEAPDAEWRRTRALALDSELERNEIRRRRRLLRAVAMIGSVLLIGAAALALHQWLQGRGEEAPAAAANTATPALDVRAETPAAPPAAVPQPSSPAPAPPAATPSAGPVGTTGSGTTPAVPPRIELRTTREVWMRTSVDGQPFRERLVPGDQSLPFNPTTTFYVRAGDAGGVRIFIDGEDRGPLGPDGRVVTRNYPIAPRAEPVQPR